MNRTAAFTIIFLLIAAIAGVGAFLVLRGEPRDNVEEYEFRPLTEAELQKLAEDTTAASGSKLSAQEERAIVASTSAPSSGSRLSEEEERALIDSMTVPGN